MTVDGKEVDRKTIPHTIPLMLMADYATGENLPRFLLALTFAPCVPCSCCTPLLRPTHAHAFDRFLLDAFDLVGSESP